MYLATLVIHSWLRYAVLGLGLWLLIAAARGNRGGEWAPAHERGHKIFLGVLDTQFLLGLLLYFVLSPLTAAAFGDMGAAISSGSFRTDGMVIAPCSAKTLAAVAHGFGENLVHRAADVVLKERRKLVLVVRETPLSTIHLENMLTVTRAGAVVLPAAPSFYSNPTTVEALLDTVVGRVLDQLGLPNTLMPRWGGGPS